MINICNKVYLNVEKYCANVLPPFIGGIYAQPAYDDVASARKRRIQNGSKWYYKRLTNNENTYRQISRSKKIQEYHNLYHKDKN
jgi:hypothetical protein